MVLLYTVIRNFLQKVGIMRQYKYLLNKLWGIVPSGRAVIKANADKLTELTIKSELLSMLDTGSSMTMILSLNTTFEDSLPQTLW